MIAWHKYPDEKPPQTGDNGIITITNVGNGRVDIDTCNYDCKTEQFYLDGHNGGGWYMEPIPDDHITYWLHINELPLPNKG